LRALRALLPDLTRFNDVWPLEGPNYPKNWLIGQGEATKPAKSGKRAEKGGKQGDMALFASQRSI